MGKLSQVSVPPASVRGLVLVAALGSSLAFAAAPQAVRGTSAASMSGAVRAYDASARTLVVMTGVGYAIRSVRVEVPPGCQIRAAGAAVGSGALTPGTPVRVHYALAREAPDKKTAQTVEVLRPQGSRGGS